MFDPNERAIGGFIPQDTREREEHAAGVEMLAEKSCVVLREDTEQIEQKRGRRRSSLTTVYNN